MGCYKFKIFYLSLKIVTRENPTVITKRNTIKNFKHTDTKDIKRFFKKSE